MDSGIVGFSFGLAVGLVAGLTAGYVWFSIRVLRTFGQARKAHEIQARLGSPENGLYRTYHEQGWLEARIQLLELLFP